MALTAARVATIIAKKPKTATVTVSAQTYNPATGATAEVDTSYTVTCSPPIRYTQWYVDGDTVQSGDAKLYVSASGLDFTPANGQKWTVDGTAWRVLDVTPYDVGGDDDVIAYKLHVREK